MPRKHRRELPPPQREDTRRAVEVSDDGDWMVTQVTGSAATRAYRCPGCDHEIRPATPHIVAWREDQGIDTRRHWHTPCWRSRSTRRPTGRAGRG